ncbi:MAG: c-type cytochrome [Candidatus Methylomirabilia bacterium]
MNFLRSGSVQALLQVISVLVLALLTLLTLTMPLAALWWVWRSASIIALAILLASNSRFVRSVCLIVITFSMFAAWIQPPAPWSVVKLFMAVVLLAVLVYVSSDSDSWRAFLSPIRSTLVDDGKRPLRYAVMVLLPVVIGYYAYTQAAPKIEAPVELRTIHPAPPGSITFRGKTIDVQGLDNPLGKDTANYDRYVAEGAEIYIKNCVYCHGDNLDGGGHFAHAFSPLPANFQDPGTIAMLQESFLFWRIAKGGPGLPRESTPWNSVMPAWEDRLTEDEIWKVIMFLYAFTGYQPRRWEAHASLSPSPVPSPRSGERAGSGGAGVHLVRSILNPVPAAAQQAADAAAGEAIYDKRCAWCHGVEGKGDGPGAGHLDPKPRDFTRGAYKIRATESGYVPLDQDLFKVITDGMPGTSMPPWNALPKQDRWNLVAYLKTFASDSFEEEPEVVELPEEVRSSPESLARGKEMFEAIECNKCHGDAGRGDGPSAPELEDDWGNPIRPANLTKPWTFRGGSSAKEIATRLATGLMGTPMPSFFDSVEFPEDIWHLANYVKSLGPVDPRFATILPVKAIGGEIPEDPNAPFWSEQASANFPLAGQVIVDPRNFAPSVDMISVRAVYSEAEIAFHLTWDDPTASTPAPEQKTFADAVALQFPLESQAGLERPYVLMGDGSEPVYLLRWTSEGGVGEANASGVGKLTPQAGEAVQARGSAVFSDGQYRLVIKRPRATPDQNDTAFPTGEFLSVAFMAWDGGVGETGSKMSFSSWYHLRLEEAGSTRPYIIPPLAVLLTVGLQLLLVRRARQGGQGG